MAIGTSEVVDAALGSDRLRRKSFLIHDPATGALIIAPEHVGEARDAMAAEMRRLKFSLNLLLAKLYFLKFWFQIKGALLNVVCNFQGNLAKLNFRRRCHIKPPQ